jgi:glycosyltransferase involved in cell wall biosynthesis
MKNPNSNIFDIQPRCSVCIATYNGEKYIYEQIESILCQLDVNDEIIVSDDDSTDNTLAIIKSFNDERISIYVNQRQKGYAGNFESALNYARGEYIFFADQDDIWMKGKIEKCLAYLQYYDFVVSDAMIVDENKKTLYDSFYKMRKPYKTLSGNLFKFGYIGCCFAFRQNVKQKALSFPPKHSHDNWICLIAMAFFKVKVLDEKLILYRRHTSNTSTGGFVSKNNMFYKIKYRLRLIYFLTLRCFDK